VNVGVPVSQGGLASFESSPRTQSGRPFKTL
jgi:hypothetical protein